MTLASHTDDTVRRGDLVDQSFIDQAHHVVAAIALIRNKEKAEKGARQLVVDGVICCWDCRDEISEVRLKAKPHATLCLDCKERRDPKI
mgnify:CR=1 FL=1